MTFSNMKNDSVICNKSLKLLIALYASIVLLRQLGTVSTEAPHRQVDTYCTCTVPTLPLL
jgi:hypothetical protein